MWARGHLPDGDGRTVALDVNGLAVDCLVPAEDGPVEGATSFGLLSASLSACTATSVRTFLRRWDVPGAAVTVHVSFEAGPPPVLHRRAVWPSISTLTPAASWLRSSTARR